MEMDELMKKIGDKLNLARDKVLDLTDKAGKKAGEVYDVAKLKIKLNDIKRDISSLYREIGQAAYNAFQAGEDVGAAVAEKCGAVENLYREMEELAKKVEEETGEIIEAEVADENAEEKAEKPEEEASPADNAPEE